jgi:hypothetical protein
MRRLSQRRTDRLQRLNTAATTKMIEKPLFSVEI